MVQLRKFNLIDSFAGLGPFDIVFCRNVLIYFDRPPRSTCWSGPRKVLARTATWCSARPRPWSALTEAFRPLDRPARPLRAEPARRRGRCRASSPSGAEDAARGPLSVLRQDLDLGVAAGLDVEFALVDLLVVPGDHGVFARGQHEGREGADAFGDDVAAGVSTDHLVSAIASPPGAPTSFSVTSAARW